MSTIKTAKVASGHPGIKADSLPGSSARAWALTALALFLPMFFFPWSYDAFVLPKQVLLYSAILAALVAPDLPADGRLRPPIGRLDLAVLGVLGAALAATVSSPVPYVSLAGTYQQYNGVFTLGCCVLLYFMAARVFCDPRLRGYLFAAAVLSGAEAACYGIAQHFGLGVGQWDLSAAAGTEALSYRSFATLASPSFLGLYLAMILPLALAKMDQAPGIRQNIAWGAALAAIAVCLIFTYSRAAWLGALGGIALYAWGAIRKKPCAGAGGTSIDKTRPRHGVKVWRWWGMLVVVNAFVLGVILAPLGGRPSALHRAASITNLDGGSVQVRLKLWRGACKMFAARPIFGWGPDTFRFVFPRFAPPGMKEAERRNVSAHNIFIDRLAETGLLGLAACLWLIVSVIGQLLRGRDTAAHSGSNLAIGASLLAYLVSLQFGFSSIAPRVLAWLLLGCLAGGDSSRIQVWQVRFLPQSLTKAFSSALVAAWIMLTAWTIRIFIADIHFKQGQTAWAREQKTQAMSMFGQAAALHPGQDFYLVRLGMARETLGLSGEEQYQAAVRANELNAANHALLAHSLQAAGLLEPALAEWRRTVELDPWWAEAWNALGLILARLGRDEEAVAAYRAAVRIDPAYAAAYKNLGDAYGRLGREQEAAACYERAEGTPRDER